MSSTILIIEDEARLASILEGYLRHEGYHTEVAHDGARGLELWRAAAPDLILLDLMLPKLDGFEVARHIRTTSSVPIIMLSAKDEEIDKLLGLGLGADDYVVKPYSPREVLARVRAVLRRTSGQVTGPERFVVGPLEIDSGAYVVHCAGEEVSLTVAEIRLLATLAKEPNQVKERHALLAASSDDGLADERTVDAHIKNIRRKLGAHGVLIETVRGVGYRLRDKAKDDPSKGAMM